MREKLKWSNERRRPRQDPFIPGEATILRTTNPGSTLSCGVSIAVSRFIRQGTVNSVGSRVWEVTFSAVICSTLEKQSPVSANHKINQQPRG